MGGDCLNTGCVPSKALIRSARARPRHPPCRRLWAGGGEPAVDFRAVMARIRGVIETIAPGRQRRALHRARRRRPPRVMPRSSIRGRSRSATDGATRRLTTRSIVIAAGGRAVRARRSPAWPRPAYLTSDTMWDALAARDRVARPAGDHRRRPDRHRDGAGLRPARLAGHPGRGRRAHPPEGGCRRVGLRRGDAARRRRRRPHRAQRACAARARRWSSTSAEGEELPSRSTSSSSPSAAARG